MYENKCIINFNTWWYNHLILEIFEILETSLRKNRRQQNEFETVYTRRAKQMFASYVCLQIKHMLLNQFLGILTKKKLVQRFFPGC